jgi:hypothetical protein
LVFFRNFGFEISGLNFCSQIIPNAIFYLLKARSHLLLVFQFTTTMGRSNESPVWKLETNGIKLFTKLSATEAQCNVCVDSATNGPKKIKLVNGNTTVLVTHLSQHPEYKKQLDELKKHEEKKAEARKGSLNSFLIKGKL